LKSRATSSNRAAARAPAIPTVAQTIDTPLPVQRNYRIRFPRLKSTQPGSVLPKIKTRALRSSLSKSCRRTLVMTLTEMKARLAKSTASQYARNKKSQVTIYSTKSLKYTRKSRADFTMQERQRLRRLWPKRQFRTCHRCQL